MSDAIDFCFDFPSPCGNSAALKIDALAAINGPF